MEADEISEQVESFHMETDDATSDSWSVSDTVFEIGEEVGLTREQVLLLPAFRYEDLENMSVHSTAKYIANKCKADVATIQMLFDRVKPNIDPRRFVKDSS